VNQPGVQHYSDLIDLLLANDITPAVTLYHWDLPQALNDDRTAGTAGPGWLNPATVGAFRLFAETCFAAYGDRVQTWITFNEAFTFIHQGYGGGSHAPNRCSDRTKCFGGDSATEQYLAGHNVLLAHAAAVHSFRTAGYSGEIGITINGNWATPLHGADNAGASWRVEFPSFAASFKL
jgi:beta-glucosidase